MFTYIAERASDRVAVVVVSSTADLIVQVVCVSTVQPI